MASDKITVSHVIFPVFLLSLVLAGLLCYQTYLLIGEQSSLHVAYSQQDKPTEELQKIKAQLNALAVGTLHLSQQGNKDAETIIGQLKKAGVDVSDHAQGAAPLPTPAP